MKNSSRSPFWRIVAFSWALLSLLSIAWSMTTPIAAAPDEPAHLIKAASVVRGEFVGVTGGQGQIVHVSAYIAYTHSQTCVAFKPNITADCIPQYLGDPSEIVEVPTTAGLYNPVYYLIMGWPSLIFNDQAGIFAMRAVSAIVSSLFLALGFAMICGWARRLLPIIGAVTAITPMVLFLNGTVTPNSLETAATFAAFVGVLGILRQPDNAHLARNSTIVFIAAALSANARGLSPLWLAVALLVPFVLSSKARIVELLRLRAVQFTIAGVAIAVVAAAAWLLGSNSLGAGLGEPAERIDTPGLGVSPIIGFVWTLFATFRYALAIVGVFGWLDTPSPELVYFTWSVLAGGIIILAFIVLRGKRLVFAATLTAAAVLLPAIVQGIYVTGGGVVWQGRYTLPLFVCAMVGLTAVLGDRLTLPHTVSRRLLVIVLALVTVAQFQAFATALRRYASGLDSGWDAMLAPAWSPPGGIPLWIGAFALLLAVSAWSIVVFVRRHPELPDAHSLAGVIDTGSDLPGTNLSGTKQPDAAHQKPSTRAHE